MKYTDEQIEKLLIDIYEGRVNVRNLPLTLYNAIAEFLTNGIFKGWGKTLDKVPLNSSGHTLLNLLRENVYIFSGAKTYQQVREMGAIAADAATFTDFRKKAFEIYELYNKTWLETEYNTAVGQATEAEAWNDIQENKELFPYLQYSAVIDDRTSEICEPLNGIILPVDDPMWDQYAPLNHFNCRCTLIKIDKYESVELTSKEKVSELKKEMNVRVDDAFKMNPGKTGYIFDPKSHPYFKVAPEDKDFAKENFNLPIPE